MSLPVVDDSNFDVKVLQSDAPVVVMFSAPWCGPCKTMGPIVESVSGELSGKVFVCKVDIQESPDTAQWCNIRSVPTFITFKDGKEATRKVGAMPAASLRMLAESLLAERVVT